MTITALTTKVQKGFTLVELLVVIAILGILAAALLATLDPLEQIRKGQDSNARTLSVEYGSAINRYYTTRTAWPWTATTVTPAGDGCNTNAAPVGAGSTGSTTGLALTTLGTCTTALTNAQELKATFAKVPAATTNTIFIWSDNTTVRSCFLPTSKSLKRIANQSSSGADCTATETNTNNCVICAQ